jgi:glucose-1-phosphate adenylyltransferase
VQVGAGGRVESFAYKPERPQAHDGRATVTTEVFVYDLPQLLATLDRLAAEVERRDDLPHLQDFGDHLLPALVDSGRAHAVAHGGYWRDVGTPGSYWRGHMDLLGDDPQLALDDASWPVRTSGSLRMPALVTRGAEVEDSFIAQGARVEGRVVRSILGPGVVIEPGAEVCDAVLLHEVVVRRGARVSRAVLDEGVEIGADARVDGSGADAPDDAVTVIGFGARVEAGAQVAPGSAIDAVPMPGSVGDA